jgi:hypothetical protein
MTPIIYGFYFYPNYSGPNYSGPNKSDPNNSEKFTYCLSMLVKKNGVSIRINDDKTGWPF